MIEESGLQVSQELQELSERIGTFFFNWGLKRIHGRIWTHLLLAKDPLDAPILIKAMGISKALVSISLKELQEIDAVKVVGKSDRRTVRYIANADISSVVLTVLRKRERLLLTDMQVAQNKFLATPAEEREQAGVSDQNLSKLGTIIAEATAALDSFIGSPT